MTGVGFVFDTKMEEKCIQNGNWHKGEKCENVPNGSKILNIGKKIAVRNYGFFHKIKTFAIFECTKILLKMFKNRLKASPY